MKYLIMVACWAAFAITATVVNIVLRHDIIWSIITLLFFSSVGLLIGVKIAAPVVKFYYNKDKK